MLNRMDYQIGEQPCADFTPGEPAAGVAAKIAACPGCEGTICLCEKCKRDHHSAGWGTCDRRISCKVAGAALRMGLYALTQLLDVLDDWALAAGFEGIRRLIYDQRKDIWAILEWFGAPFANTNTNSNSKEDLDSRITNSNSSSNTNYEEQAP